MKLGKKILLVNNVVWNETYPTKHPLKDVTAWFKKTLKPLRKFRLRTIYPESAGLPLHFERADAIILTGSPRNAWSDDFPTLRLIKFLQNYAKKGKPILGICYGHQILARAFGGQVHPNPKGWEVGHVPITLTKQGKNCPLFENMPETFSVIQSHRDIVTPLPTEAILLAKGSQTVNQAFQVGKAAFGVQFHPEMNRAILDFLWKPRLTSKEFKLSFNVRERIQQAPEASHNAEIILNFIRNFA